MEYVVAVLIPLVAAVIVVMLRIESIGNAFDSLVSAGAYAYLLKKQRIHILRVE